MLHQHISPVYDLKTIKEYPIKDTRKIRNELQISSKSMDHLLNTVCAEIMSLIVSS